MPELPDVEVARRRLKRWLVRAVVTAAKCSDAHLTRPDPASRFAKVLVGRTVEGVARKGKWLRLELSDGGKVFSHLGMTGDWVRVPVDASPVRFERARIDVARSGKALAVRYVDARRFGRLVAALDDIDDWTALGPDPLADGIDVPRLSGLFAKSRRSVKEILMDQRVLAGVGNILANEALWDARLDPRSTGKALLPEDACSLARAVQVAIRRELGEGTPYRSEQESRFRVYGRGGEPCPRCRHRLTTSTLGGRSTVYCPHCQIRR
ncbi:MAG TPA: DNA-formamidopyrimidine glycosylase family protein [Polyangiaceae bacterium]|jgi:formamidopyrimidine-DNA glycosylase